MSHVAFLKNARNSEETLRKEAIERTDISHLKDTCGINSGEAVGGTMYQVKSTGAVVSLNSAVGLIHFYCSQLPSDRSLSLCRQIQRHTHEANLHHLSCMHILSFCNRSTSFMHAGIQFFIQSLQ